jgi:hypothetical protein
VAIVQAQGPTTVFAPQTVWLSAAAGKEYLYQWKRNGQNIANATGVTYEAKESGSYAVAVSRGECSRESAATAVRIDIPLSISALSLPNAIKIFPNPTTGMVKIETKNQAKNIHLRLIDGMGRLLLEQIVNEAPLEIDLRLYPSAKYWLQLIDQDNTYAVPLIKIN